MSDLLRTNKVKIVGRLIDADMKPGTRKDNGAGYISGTATVQSTIGGATKEYEISFYANEQTQDKKVSKLYTSYSKMAELKGKKVEITGELRENRYYSNNAKQVVSAQQISGRFVRGVSESTEDEASFELGGFVVTELLERKNKEGEIYRYDIQLGQSNFSGTGMSMFVVSARPEDKKIIDGLRGYRAGETATVHGLLDWTSETVTKETPSGFGSATVRTYTNRKKSFWVEGGSVVATKEEEGMYPASIIRDLVSAYKAKDVELKDKAPAEDKGGDVEEKPTISARQTSLI